MLVALLVMMLLHGPTVLVFLLGSPPFLVLYTGLLLTGDLGLFGVSFFGTFNPF